MAAAMWYDPLSFCEKIFSLKLQANLSLLNKTNQTGEWL